MGLHATPHHGSHEQPANNSTAGFLQLVATARANRIRRDVDLATHLDGLDGSPEKWHDLERTFDSLHVDSQNNSNGANVGSTGAVRIGETPRPKRDFPNAA